MPRKSGSDQEKIAAVGGGMYQLCIFTCSSWQVITK